MFPSWLQILLVVMLALIFFGRGKISDFMTDLASGIKSFKKGISDDDENTAIEDNEDKE
ncbi:MAG: twin-arginine translocase TatA/TatE family subunit [Alphaproteobacteria bacterium]|jgi:sec-independent protein translocase protein TatA|tara:strand:- start:587 stop:763 length:177 start_codon:yes stop_codon:yes gene_type:complete